MSARRPRITFAVTHPATADLLLRGQLRFLRENGYDVTVVASPGLELERVRDREGVDTRSVAMSREVRPVEGPAAFLEMRRALRDARPDLLNASTPKAALLALVAARTLAIPRRVYLLRGLRLEGMTGARRAALAIAERVTARASDHVVCVSESLRQAYARDRLFGGRASSVIPSNGVDVDRFGGRDAARATAAALRERLGVPANALVVGFVGRLVPDKGVVDIIDVAERIAQAGVETCFLIVGGDLAGDRLPEPLARRLDSLARVIRTGRVDEPAPYYAAMDVLLFPSYREGLPNVPLEAAACEVPTVGYRVTGVVDAVADGVTGLLVDRGDSAALAGALSRYLADRNLRRSHGADARARVLEHFEQRRVWARWLQLYRELLEGVSLTSD